MGTAAAQKHSRSVFHHRYERNQESNVEYLHVRYEAIYSLIRQLHLANEVVSKIGGKHLGHKLRSEVFAVGSHSGNDPGSDAEAIVHRADRVEEWLLVLLEVLVIRAG